MKISISFFICHMVVILSHGHLTQATVSNDEVVKETEIWGNRTNPIKGTGDGEDEAPTCVSSEARDIPPSKCSQDGGAGTVQCCGRKWCVSEGCCLHGEVIDCCMGKNEGPQKRCHSTNGCLLENLAEPEDCSAQGVKCCTRGFVECVKNGCCKDGKAISCCKQGRPGRKQVDGEKSHDICAKEHCLRENPYHVRKCSASSGLGQLDVLTGRRCCDGHVCVPNACCLHGTPVSCCKKSHNGAKPAVQPVSCTLVSTVNGGAGKPTQIG